MQIEVEVDCELSVRQRRLYEGIKQKITLEDLLSANNATSKAESDAASKHLMNLVMQFRKVRQCGPRYDTIRYDTILARRPALVLGTQD
jgi:hypothetical protein